MHLTFGESPAGRSARAKSAAFCLIAAVVSAAVTLTLREHPRPMLDRQAAVGELIAALVSADRVDGRLVGGRRAPDRAAGNVRRSSHEAPAPELLIAIARVELSVRGADDAEADAARAMAALARDDVDRAVQMFEFALARAPVQAAVWSDAAAAFLTVSKRRDRPELAIRALAAAREALALEPALREAQFNRALALESVGLTRQALAAWRAYAETAVDPWRAAARAQERSLREVIDTADEWPALRTRLETNADAGRAPRLDAAMPIARFRQRIREWIEGDLLAAWGRAVLAGDPASAARFLTRARYAADLLARAEGDEQPLQGIRVITAAQDGAPRRRAAAAHLALAEAARLFDEGAVSAAAARFGQARPALLALGSPYAAWGSVYESVRLYGGRRLEQAFAVLESPAARGGGNHRYLRGRQAWLRALVRLHQGQLAAALDHYTEALGHFEAVGEYGSAAAVSSLLAESLFSLGDRTGAWQRQRDAVRQVPNVGVPRRRHLILLTAGLMCLDEGLPRAALEFQDAVIEAASEEGRPSSLVNAHLQRARNRKQLGELAGARNDLRRAQELLPLVEEPTLRRRNEAEIWAAEAVVLPATAPEEARAAATRAIDYFSQHDGQLFLPSLYLARTRAERAAGNIEGAEADALAAIAAFERQRALVGRQQYREALFQDGWSAYDELVGLRVARGDTAGALDVAERARARTLLEQVVANREPTSAPLSLLRRQWPEGTAAIYFVVRTDSLFIWTITRNGLRFFDRPMGASELRRRVEAVRFLLSYESDPAAATRALRDLFGDLVGPLRDEIAGHPTLIVVPDGPLHTLPFAALLDPASGRYLVEDHVIAVAPSLSLSTPGAVRPVRAEDSRALIIANTQPVTAPGIDLPPLPHARQEARAIAAFYGADTTALIDEQATAAAFRRYLPEVDVVHYAGHALSDARTPERSRLFLRAPHGGDGAVYASELANLRLERRPVVVLASCSTHAGRIAAAEGLQSLARPFLAAGASAVVATLWDVRDSDAGELFTAFHERLQAGEGSAGAVASVQRAAIYRDRGVGAAGRWAWAVSIGGVDPMKEETR